MTSPTPPEVSANPLPQEVADAIDALRIELTGRDHADLDTIVRHITAIQSERGDGNA
jgi:ribosomal protein S10